jgi:EAL domain-containing protein (putative c-di-GMP-specific phosphodiesterase class I)
MYNDLLMTMTRRLKSYLAEFNSDEFNSLSDVYKLDGPEFALIFHEKEGIDGLDEKVSALINVISAPFYIDEYELQVTPSIGAAISEHEDDMESLFSKAGEARKLAGITEMDKSFIYLPDMTVKAKRKLSMMAELRKAIEKDELVLFYQPQINLKNNKITGLEALLRWNSSEFGFVSPAEFIPLAEESGLILPIGDFVIDQACQQAAIWHQAGYNELRVAVNMSAKQIHRRNLMNYIGDSIDKYKLDPRYFEIELTESALAQDIGMTTELLHQLKNLGIRTAIDDFGTGYSSLSYLSQLPFDVLKIDRSFVQSLDTGKSSSKLIEAIISMGKGLELEVLAEGVETDLQRQYLSSNLCDTIQGYLFSKPQSASNIQTLFTPNMQQLA